MRPGWPSRGAAIDSRTVLNRPVCSINLSGGPTIHLSEVIESTRLNRGDAIASSACFRVMVCRYSATIPAFASFLGWLAGIESELRRGFALELRRLWVGGVHQPRWLEAEPIARGEKCSMGTS